MSLPNKNVLPDSSPETTGTPIEVPIKGEQPVEQPTEEPTAPVDPPQTPPAPKVEEKQERTVPLSALEQERQWRKDWEQKYKDMETTVAALNAAQTDITYEVPSDPASPDVQALTAKLEALERKAKLQELERENPVLADKKSEFEEYLQDEEMKKLSIERAAKLFMAESGLTQAQTSGRTGLEKPRGGGHTTPNQGISSDEIKLIREKEPRKYIRMLREGVINPEDIR